MNNFLPPLSLQRWINAQNPQCTALGMDAFQHRRTGGRHVYAQGEGRSIHAHPTCCLLSLGLVPVCQLVCCLPVCLPAAPVQVTIWGVPEQARRGPPGQHSVERSKPRGECPTPGKSPSMSGLLPAGWGVVSYDMMPRLMAHCQPLCFQPRQLLITCG